ncbi:MAG: RtcB family protein [Planctomycetaceae bacterium]|nr:RtcB family protein [Planctomycetaceae bacterium]MCB9953699.1 RtcB family protein [Planctomycetaceae bacterium]
MNRRQFLKLGVADAAVRTAIQAVQLAAAAGMRGATLKNDLRAVCENPADFIEHEHFGTLARELVELNEEGPSVPREPIAYRTWGADHIDDASHHQMREACSLPNAVGAALMPDAHVGYGLPIGGVLALENAVCPYAVGVDIACRMKLSVLDMPPSALDDSKLEPMFDKALNEGTVFGTGKSWQRRQEHSIMDADWTITRVTREGKDKAWSQLGTSGSGNHFVEFGTITLEQPDLGLEAGTYLALLSHSGSRGIGHQVCSVYSTIARNFLPRKYEDFGRLAWLDLDKEVGQEYWAAMNLMGEYAAANHAVIHRNVSKLCGAKVIAGVENHHNFAWKEIHGGREVIVHRKGATPAGKGVLGMIPGSMATPGFVVRGLGQPESLDSASHGAGRVMSRKKARDMFRFNAVRNDLRKKGIRVLSAGSDEVPGVYKDIHQVLDEQRDLVEVIARFDPRVVKMCDDGSRAED